MRAFIAIIAILTVVSMAAIGCSDGSSAGGAGGSSGGRDAAVDTRSGGGAGGHTTAAGTGGTTITAYTIPSDCNLPACYANLISNCAPGGGCVEEQLATSDHVCYANGVKALSDYDAASGNQVMTFKKDGTTCHSLTLDSTSGAFIIKDSSGKTVGTIQRSSTGATMVTCSGQDPVTLSSACDAEGSAYDPGVVCTAGACTS